MHDSTQTPKKDFFISYTEKDRPWAEWIGWILEEAEYSVLIDVWDFRPGTNFILGMHKGTQYQQTIAVFSEAYFKASYTNPEWAAALADDPQGEKQKLIPIRVEKFKPAGLLKALVYVDFVGVTETEAESRLLGALKPRGKPDNRPSFPGMTATAKDARTVPQKVDFPGSTSSTVDASESGDASKTGTSNIATSPSNNSASETSDTSDEVQNPFWPRTGIIEDPQQFFNCEKTLQRIFESLNSGSSVAIIGEPGTGKSSLLRAVYRMAPKQLTFPYHPVWLNLAKVFSEHDFYEDLCTELGMEALKGNRFVRTMYRQDRKFLLLLDEVERISQKEFTHAIRQELRGLSEGREAPLRLVITTRTSLDKLFPESYVDGQTSPLEGLCVEEHIQPWPEATSRQFIAQRLSHSPIQFTDIEVNQLVRECNGYPQKLMEACHQLYNRYREARS